VGAVGVSIERCQEEGLTMYKKGEWWSGFTQKPESVEEKESNPKGGGSRAGVLLPPFPGSLHFNSLSYSGIQADFIDQVELYTISYASLSLLCSLLSQPESRNPSPLPRNVVKAHLSHLLLLPFPQFAHPLQVLRPSRSYETSFRLLSLELGSESDLSTRKKNTEPHDASRSSRNLPKRLASGHSVPSPPSPAVSGYTTTRSPKPPALTSSQEFSSRTKRRVTTIELSHLSSASPSLPPRYLPFSSNKTHQAHTSASAFPSRPPLGLMKLWENERNKNVETGRRQNDRFFLLFHRPPRLSLSLCRFFSSSKHAWNLRMEFTSAGKQTFLSAVELQLKQGGVLMTQEGEELTEQIARSLPSFGRFFAFFLIRTPPTIINLPPSLFFFLPKILISSFRERCSSPPSSSS